jgi:hypothetical protein
LALEREWMMGMMGTIAFIRRARPPARTGGKLAGNKLKLCVIALKTGEW